MDKKRKQPTTEEINRGLSTQTQAELARLGLLITAPPPAAPAVPPVDTTDLHMRVRAGQDEVQRQIAEREAAEKARFAPPPPPSLWETFLQAMRLRQGK